MDEQLPIQAVQKRPLPSVRAKLFHIKFPIRTTLFYIASIATLIYAAGLVAKTLQFKARVRRGTEAAHVNSAAQPAAAATAILVTECLARHVQFAINGRPCQSTRVLTTLTDHDSPSGTLLRLDVQGTCGPFTSSTLYLRANTSDIQAFNDIYLLHAFSFLDKAMGRQPPQNIMDLGLTVELSLPYWASTYPGSTVIGIEPDLGNSAAVGVNLPTRPNVFLERPKVVDVGAWVGRAKSNELSDSFASVTLTHLKNKYSWDRMDVLTVDIDIAELSVCNDIALGADYISNVTCVVFVHYDRNQEMVSAWEEGCRRILSATGWELKHQVNDIYSWCR